MTIATNPAAKLLQMWLSNGSVASQYEAYVAMDIRGGTRSFYPKVLAEHGLAAAEKRLREWNNRSRFSDFAACLEPAARGMLAMANIDSTGEYVKVVDVTSDMQFPRCYGVIGPSQVVVMFNRQAPGCGCNQPAGANVLGPFGDLQLKGLTLEVGTDRLGKYVAQLGVILPLWSTDQREGYSIATIQPNGHADVRVYTPRIDMGAHLRYSLGLGNLDRVVGGSYLGGSLGDVLGFPGATNYLADTLPGVEEYFTELAKRLSGDHVHRTQ